MADNERKESTSTISTATGLDHKKATPTVSASGQKTDVKPRPVTSSSGAAASDRETDTDIFALGEAASCLDNLDDVLTGFGLNVKEVLADEAAGGTGRYAFTSDSGDLSQLSRFYHPGDDLTGVESSNSVQVSTISKNFPDGRSVHTRIIQGPIRCKKRIVRVMRETANGQELLAELEAPTDCDVSKVLDSIPTSILLSGGAAKRRFSNGQYDNWKYDVTHHRTSNTDVASQVSSFKEDGVDKVQQQMPNGGMNISPRSRQVLDAKLLESPRILAGGKKGTHGRPSISRDKDSTVIDIRDQEDLLKRRKRFESVTEEEIKLYIPSEGLLVLREEGEGDEDEEEVKHSLCWSCANIIRSKGKSMPKSFIELSKGKLCMTSSEINEDERSLPAAQLVVANYARMLVDNRRQFVDTMFRAVKLNKLDVTKILCKIIIKSGLKLGQHDFRETESSATILHVALLYNHVDIIDFLLDIGDRELIMARYEMAEYRNQTSLHVAVANGNPVLVEKLLMTLNPDDQVELVNTLADGHYFKEQHPHGQLCLTGAAWAGSGQVIKTIVKFGGKLDMKNLHGNTLLHSIILQASQHPGRNDYRMLFDSVFESVAIWAEQMSYDAKFAQQRELEKSQMSIALFKKLLNCRNHDGLTPLGLAMVKTSKLFSHMINLEKVYKIPQNKLGSIAWVTYDVTEIASFTHDSYNKFSVLHILAHSSQHLSRHANIDQEEDYMEMEPIKTIMTRKWDVYRWIYILWFVVHVSYMIVFTASTSEANSSCFNSTQCQPFNETPPNTGLAMFLVLPVIYLLLELLDLFGSHPYRYQYMTGQNFATRLIKGIRSEWTIMGNGPYRMVSVGFSCFTIYWFVQYIYSDDYQDMGLAMSLLLGWIFVLFFTRGCRVTCRFSIMIQKMFFRDLIYFLTVYAIVLVGFSFAMNIMFETSNITKVFYDMMSVVTDLDQKQSVKNARHPFFAKLLLIFYAIIAVILLMNMLIAMMNTSYETVRVTRCNLWRQQQLCILLMIERRFFWLKWLCRKSERDVWKREATALDETERSYVDVTMLHTPSYRCV